MVDSLKSKTTSALFWSFCETVGTRGVQFVVGVILARLLMPAQFGLIGMLTIFIAVAQIFIDSGFGAALIQRTEITEADICSVFYFNIFLSCLAAGCIYLVSPLVADFYTQPVLTTLLRVMSLVIVINAFGLVPTVLLRRELDFKIQTRASLIAVFFSGVVGIYMAYTGFGVWSLVAQQIANATLHVFLLWVFSQWRPSLVFSCQSLKEMFGFASRLLSLGLLNTIFDNIYLIVIGRVFSPTSLGYFVRADNLQKLPSTVLASIVTRITFPIFSKIKADLPRVKKGMKKALLALVFINFPMMIGLAVVAKPLVLIMLTDKWLPCVPYLQVLCLIGIMFPLHLINLNVLQALGRSDLLLKIEIIKKILIVINIMITWRWGILAMIWGQVLISLFSYYLNAYYNKVLLNYSIWEQLGDVLPYFVISVLMGGAVYALGFVSFYSSLLMLICQIIVGGLIYLLLCRVCQLHSYMLIQKKLIRCRW